ncbi:MAG TPA: DUF2232 domain-containing protein [Symbiobacteriaceae bacterium]|nr:DUF2232 domain-containing protein [Symbiobacteriaceae bacterium]
MQRRSGVQGMVFGGIMAGILLVCALIPFLGILLPIPLVLVYVRYGGRAAVLTAVVSALLTAMFKGPIQAFIITVPGGILPGLAFGFGFRRGLKPLVIGLLAVAVFFGGYAADYVVTRAVVLGGQDPFENALKTEEGRRFLENNTKTMEAYLNTQKPSTDSQKAALEQQRAMLAELRENPIGVVWATLPIGLFLFGSFFSWVNYGLCRAILPRFGHPVPAPSPFSRFALPIWLIWAFVLTNFGTAYVGNSIVAAPWWVKVAVNIASPLAMIIALCGLAVAYGWLRIKQNMSKPAAVVVAVAPILLLGMNMVGMYTMLAMLDTVFDFRGLGHGLFRRRPADEPPEESDLL